MEEKAAEYTAILEANIKAQSTELETTVAMEELADVDIVITELMMMFDISAEEFYGVMARKVQRIRKRLEEKRE